MTDLPESAAAVARRMQAWQQGHLSGVENAELLGAVRDAVNEAAGAIHAVREWCEKEARMCRDDIAAGTCASGTDTYCAECVECTKARLKAIEEVRSLLPPVPEVAEGVDMDGTRVTFLGDEDDDREYFTRGGTDSGN